MGGRRADRRTGPMLRSSEAPVGGRGHTQDAWPQATNLNTRAKRLTKDQVPAQHQGDSWRRVGRASDRVAPTADKPAPAQATLHKACCVNPQGAKRYRATKELATDWPGTSCSAALCKSVACGRSCGYRHHRQTRHQPRCAASRGTPTAPQRSDRHMRSTDHTPLTPCTGRSSAACTDWHTRPSNWRK